jgi:hypothetical protein
VNEVLSKNKFAFHQVSFLFFRLMKDNKERHNPSSCRIFERIDRTNLLLSLSTQSLIFSKDDRVRSTAPLDNMAPLPRDWQPNNWSVICGSGKATFNHCKRKTEKVDSDNQSFKQRPAATLFQDAYSNLRKHFSPRWTAVGNRRFRILIQLNLEKYKNSKNRAEKSLIVMSIVDTIREASKTGGFVKKVRFASSVRRFLPLFLLYSIRTQNPSTILATAAYSNATMARSR